MVQILAPTSTLMTNLLEMTFVTREKLSDLRCKGPSYPREMGSGHQMKKKRIETVFVRDFALRAERSIQTSNRAQKQNLFH